jgi:uncharacterized repeat protein (TIGR01451 family)
MSSIRSARGAAPRRLTTIARIALAAILCGVFTGSALGVRDYTKRFPATGDLNTAGDIAIVGNTLMTCPAVDSRCAGAQAGGNLNDNTFNMTYVDGDADASTFDSSSAVLTLPARGDVLFAGLYWGADTSNGGAAGGAAPAPVPPTAAAPNAALRGQVAFRTPASGAYTAITATQIDTNDPAIGGQTGTRYQGFADVTSLVQAGGAGTYTVANVQAGTGADRYAGWSLVVVRTDPAADLRNLTVFDGYQSVSGSLSPSATISGFLTPVTGAVSAALGAVSYEGDLGLTGDQVQMQSGVLTTSLADAANPVNNVFNSTISAFGALVGAKTPNYVNQLGFDIDLLDASAAIPNAATSATFTFSSTSDVYFPGPVTTSVKLQAPRVQPSLVKSVADDNGGQAEPGDVLTYTIPVANTGLDPAAGLVLTDAIPAGTQYVAGSLEITTGPNAGAKTDAPGDDQAEFDAAGNRVVFRLGPGANATNGGTLPTSGPDSVTGVRFKVRISATAANGSSITNRASTAYAALTSGQRYASPSNLVTTIVAAAPRLVVEKSDAVVTDTAPSGPSAGDTIGYTLTVRNAGTAPATGLRLSDALDANVAVIPGSLTTTQGAVIEGSSAGDRTVVVDLGTLGVGATATVRFRVRVRDPLPHGVASIANQAVVSGSNTGAVGSDDPATAPVGDATVTRLGRFVISTSGPGSVRAGTSTSMKVGVRNGCAVTARNVRVTITLPTSASLVRRPPGSSFVNGSLVVRIRRLAAGTSHTITLPLVVVRTASGTARLRVLVQGTGCTSTVGVRRVTYLRTAGTGRTPVTG